MAMWEDANADALARYNDDQFEYRHVQLPKQMLKAIPKDYFDGSRGTLKLLWEDEWRGLGITQVSGLYRKSAETLGRNTAGTGHTEC